MSEENKNLVRRAFEEILNRKNLDAIAQVYTVDAVFRAPNMPEARGHEGYRQLVAAILTAFPDACYTIHDVIAEGDKVVTNWTVTGTHQGEWMGLKPAGKSLFSSGISICRISEGKIAEEFVQFDALGQVKQLSSPAPPPVSKPQPKPQAKPTKAKPPQKARKRTRR